MRTIVFCITLVSCSEPNFKGQASSSQSQSTKGLSGDTASGAEPATQKKNSSETNSTILESSDTTADVPQAINGAYLACATVLSSLQEASVNRTTVGCRVQAANGERFKTEAINSKAIFTVKPIELETLSLRVNTLTDTSRNYDILIDFNVANNGDSVNAAANTTVSLEVQDIATGLPLLTKSEVVKNVLTTLDSGYWISWGTDIPYMDTLTSLRWDKDNLLLYTWDEANTFCQNLTLDTQTQWRLPTIDELKIAFRDNQSRMFTGAGQMNIAISNADFYWSSTPYGISQVYGLHFKDSSLPTLPETASELQGFICVHDHY